MLRTFLLSLLFIPTLCKAQNWSLEANRVCDSMIRHFWGASFDGAATQNYFNAMGAQMSMKNEWWWQAHAMDVIVDAYVRTGNKKYLAYYEPWYEGIIGSNYEHFDDDVLHNNSIDDMEWICITLIRMYSSSGDERYLRHAKKLYENYIITTWGPDDEAPWHGGISWSSDANIHKTKNACSNGPAGIIAALLGKTDDLKRIYNWERSHLFDLQSGAVYDHIGRNGVNRALHSYNSATFIAMATHLYAETNNDSLLNDIVLAADFAIRNFAVGNRQLMSLVSRSDRGGDAGLFHGIFFRYLAELINAGILPEDKEKQYRKFLIDNAVLAKTCLVNDIDIFSRDWVNIRITNPAEAALTPHVTGAALFSAVAFLK
jgi:predicted alpha-1,6-mannanase (GH76 family)